MSLLNRRPRRVFVPLPVAAFFADRYLSASIIEATSCASTSPASVRTLLGPLAVSAILFRSSSLMRATLREAPAITDRVCRQTSAQSAPRRSKRTTSTQPSFLAMSAVDGLNTASGLSALMTPQDNRNDVSDVALPVLR